MPIRDVFQAHHQAYWKPEGCSVRYHSCRKLCPPVGLQSHPCRHRAPARIGILPLAFPGPEEIPEMHRDLEPAGADSSPRPWRPNRRVLVKAAATFSALAATFGATRVVPDRATAQESS